jgi:hypothetical protein
MKAAAVLGASLCAATAAAVVGNHLWQEPDRPVAIPSPLPARTPAPRPRRTSLAPAPAPQLPAPPAPVVPATAPAPRHRPAPIRIAPPAFDPTPALEPAPAPEPVPALEAPPPAAPAPAAAPPAPAATPEERAFGEGWEALRLGEHRRAAARMAEAVAFGGPLAEDARYWRAVALGRAHAPEEARPAMEEFLRRHPGSRRAGEVSAMLGLLLIDAGERERAAALFHAAEQDPNAGVRQSARAGLDAVAAP